jgi:hypothetical protein
MNLSRKFLAGAIVALLPLGSALACTTTAWSSATGTPVADDPDTNAATNGPDAGAVKRYSGNCGLAPAIAGTSFVTNNTPGTEGTYRARFYVYTGLATGSPKIFSAATADNGGTELISASYDRTAGELDFTATGATIASVPVVASKWYSVEILHQTGQPLNVSVAGAMNAVADTAAVTRVSTGNVTGTVGSALLGAVAGGAFTVPAGNTGGLFVDEFDSTRSAATVIGRLCRGDANGNANASIGDADLNGLDAAAVTAERLGNSIAPGQPDANEDGIINGLDASLIVSMRLANKRCN